MQVTSTNGRTSILQDLVKKRGKTVIAVTHDMDIAARVDRRIHLVDGAVVSDERVAQPVV
ncbi:MAG: transporter ATP-binding protein [Microvirga sp.]|nr:transporter ATP-binding protein [Microvirga sp.]